MYPHPRASVVGTCGIGLLRHVSGTKTPKIATQLGVTVLGDSDRGFTVDTHLDVVAFNDGITSLREAIFATNLIGGADTVEFDAALAGKTILLTQGELAALCRQDMLGIMGVYITPL